MGSSESKPDNVSDEAWISVQKSRLDAQQGMINKEKTGLEKVQKQRRDKSEQLIVHYLDYVGCCRDTPGFMMAFPSNRERCYNARAQLLRDGVDLLGNLDDEGITLKTIGSIVKMK